MEGKLIAFVTVIFLSCIFVTGAKAGQSIDLPAKHNSVKACSKIYYRLHNSITRAGQERRTTEMEEAEQKCEACCLSFGCGFEWQRVKKILVVNLNQCKCKVEPSKPNLKVEKPILDGKISSDAPKLLEENYPKTEGEKEKGGQEGRKERFVDQKKQKSTNAALIPLKNESSIRKPTKQYDVFLSYRRSTGSQLASLLILHLNKRGFSVFIDNQLGAGKFEGKILDTVRKAKNLVLVLSPRSLDSCKGDVDLKDWIHKEVVTALASKVNIIPIIDEAFVWPDPEDLPEDMRMLLSFNGVRWIDEYQDACADKLERFIKGETNPQNKFGEEKTEVLERRRKVSRVYYLGDQKRTDKGDVICEELKSTRQKRTSTNFASKH